MDGASQNDQAASHGKPVDVLREELRYRDPAALARNAGARLEGGDTGHILISYWGRGLTVGLPDFRVQDAETDGPVDEKTERLIVHYLHTADGTEFTDTWVSLAELPDGAFYRQAYQGYTGDYLALNIQNDLSTLQRVSHRLGGKGEEFGDFSCSFRVLPRLSLLVVYWRGDDEFPPTAQIHFSDTARHYLPTDICAYLGRLLVERLLDFREGV
jgi:hypothetical protein